MPTNLDSEQIKYIIYMKTTYKTAMKSGTLLGHQWLQALRDHLHVRGAVIPSASIFFLHLLINHNGTSNTVVDPASNYTT